MTDSQKSKPLSPQDKQHSVLPNESDPKHSLGAAMSAALKAKSMAKRAGKLRQP